jgi:hypothetical protein
MLCAASNPQEYLSMIEHWRLRLPDKPVDPVVGYVHAVLVASAAVTLLFIVHVGALRVFGLHPVSGTSFYREIAIALAIFVVVAVCALFTVPLPLFLAHQSAKRLAITCPWYYVACGGATGLWLWSPVVYLVFVPPDLFGQPPPRPNPLWVVYFACFGLVGGAAGGLAHWFQSGRFIRQQGATTPIA